MTSADFSMLGYFGPDGDCRSCSWVGDDPLVYVVVAGSPNGELPWRRDRWGGLEIEEIPDGVADRLAYARARGRVLAFGVLV